MCKNHNPRKIDSCMKLLIANLYECLDKETKVLACCCGHGKYTMSIIVKRMGECIFDLCSGINIPRKKRFYKKDKKGYYYIPELLKT